MKLNLYLTLNLLCFFSYDVFAQNLNWQWVKGSDVTFNTNVEVLSVASDNLGNAVIGGFVTTGNVIFGFDTVYGGPGYTPFVAKYSSAGQVLWASALPIAIDATVTYVATDPGQNVYATGASSNKLYLVKMNSNGSFAWIDSIPVSLPGNINNVTCDANGNVYFTGVFTDSTIIFGHDTLHGLSANYSPFDNYFVAKYSPAGAELWAKTMRPFHNGYPGIAISSSLTTDINDHVIVGGLCFADSLNIGNLILRGPADDLTKNLENAFIVTYNVAGNLAWAKLLSSSQIRVTDVCADNTGNIYAYGSFEDSLYLGDSLLIARPFNTFNLFILKFDSRGKLVWSFTSYGSPGRGAPAPFAITSDKNGHLFISGGAFDTFYWRGDSIFYSYNNNYSYNDSSFILQLDTAGHIICGATFKGGGDDANDLSTDPSGFVYWAGDYLFPEFIVGNDTLSAGQTAEKAYLGKFTPCGEIINSLETIPADVALEIYPNPSSSNATCKYSLTGNAADIKLLVTDILGRIVVFYPLTKSQDELNVSVSGFNSGVYFCSISSNGNTLVTKRIIVE